MSAASAPRVRPDGPGPAGPAPGRPPLRKVPGPRPRKPTAPRPGGPATTPLGVRLALLPVRLALVPVRLATTILGRLTGGRPWLVLILAMGCGVIALHAATLQTNQTLAARDLEINGLERETATLRNDVASLGSTDRVSAFGAGQGMVIADPEGVGYLDARTTDAGRAARMLAPPSAEWKPAPNPSEQNGDVVDEDGAAAGAGATSQPDPASGAGTPAAPSTAGAPGTTGTAAGSATTGGGTGAGTAAGGGTSTRTGTTDGTGAGTATQSGAGTTGGTAAGGATP